MSDKPSDEEILSELSKYRLGWLAALHQIQKTRTEIADGTATLETIDTNMLRVFCCGKIREMAPLEWDEEIETLFPQDLWQITKPVELYLEPDDIATQT